MKNRIQGILAGFLAALLLIGTVFAATTHRETKTLNYTDLKVVVDGETIDLTDASGNVVQPFSVDGVTYLPLRVMANAIGKNFASWDQQANIAYFGVVPGKTQYMTEICPAYECSRDDCFEEYNSSKSLLEKGRADTFSLGGVEYSDGFIFRRPMYSTGTGTWAVWNLNDRYSSMSGTLCHVDGTDVGTGENAELEIYLDGIFRESISLFPDMAPTPINIDLSGVSQLKILIGNSRVDSNSWTHGFYGIGNPVLK